MNKKVNCFLYINRTEGKGVIFNNTKTNSLRPPVLVNKTSSGTRARDQDDTEATKRDLKGHIEPGKNDDVLRQIGTR